MTLGNWTRLLMRQTAPWGDLGWDELVVGYDFGLLRPAEIRAWAQDQDQNQDPSPDSGVLAALLEPEESGFERRLWDAATAFTGKVPRPGGRRWARAQDRWRVALVKEALEAPLNPEALALALEAIYESVGCPEDMLGLWSAGSPWQRRTPEAHPAAVQAFLDRLDLGARTA